MKVIVKGIKGGGNTVVEVEENTTILEIKRKIATDLNIPVPQQTLILLGKTLQDEKTVGSYPKLQDGTKLFVATKKQDSLDIILTRFFRQYYTEQQSSVLVNEFMKDFYHKVDNLSLDDLERIAKADMENVNV